MYNPEKSYDPSAPTLTEPLSQHGDIHEAVNAMGVEVVDDTPPPLDPVKPESLTLKYETKAPRVPLIMSSFVMWGGIICFALFALLLSIERVLLLFLRRQKSRRSN